MLGALPDTLKIPVNGYECFILQNQRCLGSYAETIYT